MLNVVKLLTVDLEVGMYVSSLDRPWLDTPFSVQGFELISEQDIRRLQKYCQHVFVDTSRSKQDPGIIRRKVRTAPRRRPIQELFAGRKLKAYEDASDWAQECPLAVRAVQVLSEGIDTLFTKARTGVIDMVTAKKSVEPMIESAIRNPDPCVWMARMRQEEQYTYQHALGAAIWSVALGRRLGLPKSDLRSLAIGGMLFDVGKLQVDRALLDAERPLSDAEFEQVRNHVNLGAGMIEGSALMNSDVIDMIKSHHERHDGSGYPRGLKGDDIPVFARIAAIVDCYDAMTSPRAYARAVSPSRAVKLLYEWKERDFQPELVEEFIQAVGIYPAGTLVELSSKETAVVVSGYRTRRLRPRILVLLGPDGEPLPEPVSVDLLTSTITADGAPLEIVGSIEPEDCAVDITTLTP